MARLGRPDLPPVAHDRLNEALHDLHRRAGWPSLRDLERELRGGASRSKIHEAFSSARLPSWGVVELIVEALARRLPDSPVEHESGRFHQLWDAAASEVSASTFAPPASANEIFRFIDDELSPSPAVKMVLPLFVLCDESGSMSNRGRSEAMHETIRRLLRTAARSGLGHPAWVEILGFGTGARIVLPLSDPDTVTFTPSLNATGRTDLGAGLCLLASSVRHTKATLEKQGISMTAPVAVVITDGTPTDDWKEGVSALTALPLFLRPYVVGFVLGEEGDTEPLAQVVAPQLGVHRASEEKLPAMVTFVLRQLLG
jgi:uncharacterized protein YegL